MMFRIFLAVAFFSSVFFSCEKKDRIVVNEQDYIGYLQPRFISEEKKRNETEISFWQQRLIKDTGSYVNKLELANNYLHHFRISGNIRYLNLGDSLLKRSSEKLVDKDPGILFALSQNSITQHLFNNAAAYRTAAEKALGDPYIVRLLQFDTEMELGSYNNALKALNSLKDKNAFDYLIRKAKWEDHSGNTDNAILLMEQAFEKIKNKKKSLYCWTLSNLADMYGHAGRVTDAYNAYLRVLEKDPSSLYCLKGIAWIAYSHDGNNNAAKRILEYILSQTNMPDLKMMRAGIATQEDNVAETNKWLEGFIQDVQQAGYGGMYNKYLIHIYNEDLHQYDKAISLAEKELKNRFTPETCDWLAWSYYNSGNFLKAMEYTRNYVYKRTFEPEALMHTAFIYAANGKKKEAKQLLKDCLQSSFELGPVTTRKIKEKLASL